MLRLKLFNAILTELGLFTWHGGFWGTINVDFAAARTHHARVDAEGALYKLQLHQIERTIAWLSASITVTIRPLTDHPQVVTFAAPLLKNNMKKPSSTMQLSIGAILPSHYYRITLNT